MTCGSTRRLSSRAWPSWARTTSGATTDRKYRRRLPTRSTGSLTATTTPTAAPPGPGCGTGPRRPPAGSAGPAPMPSCTWCTTTTRRPAGNCPRCATCSGRPRRCCRCGCGTATTGRRCTRRRPACSRRCALADRAGVRRQPELACTPRFTRHQREWFAQVRARAAAGEPVAVLSADSPHEIYRALDIPYVVVQWWSSVIAAKQKAPGYLSALAAAGYPDDSEQYNSLPLGELLAADGDAADRKSVV